AIPLKIDKSGNVTVAQYGNGLCDIKIASQGSGSTPVVLQDAELKAVASTANGAFVGDYSKVAGMSFRVMKTTGEAPRLRLQLTGQPRPVGSGTRWTYEALKVSDGGGVWVINNVPMNRAAGWGFASQDMFTEEELDAFWAQDLKMSGWWFGSGPREV
ncbi:MAG: hypothetical protein N2255_02200, partial [Kiritimatiellae bacterium]|nr:hypothetical protein [Kiritimatiellia bacterium]